MDYDPQWKALVQAFVSTHNPLKRPYEIVCTSVFGQESRSYFVCSKYVNNSNARNFRSLHSLLKRLGNGDQELHQDLLRLQK